MLPPPPHPRHPLLPFIRLSNFLGVLDACIGVRHAFGEILGSEEGLEHLIWPSKKWGLKKKKEEEEVEEAPV